MLNQDIVRDLGEWPLNVLLRVHIIMLEFRHVIHSSANGKAVASVGIPVELFKVTLNDDPTQRQRFERIIVDIRRRREVPQLGKNGNFKVLPRKKIGISLGGYTYKILLNIVTCFVSNIC